ncbi:MAG TPA: amino acid ABC transporter permease [Firmicutes bacterium]|nr:amino acid ABC transporter permease [Bacillota bacterium]
MSFLFKNEDGNITATKKIINISLVGIILFLVLVFAFKSLDYQLRLHTIVAYRYKFINGYLMTFVIALFSLILSILIGAFFAFAGRSKFLPLYYLSKAYVEIIRGTPLLVQIYVFFYIIATAVKLTNRYVLGVVILSIFSGAYICEIIRAGIESIDKTQIETTLSLGFTPWQKYRHIIIPQIIKRILPPLAGQCASLIKDSSLLSVIAVSELTMNVQEVDAINFATFENYILLAILYLTLTLPVSYLARKFEQRFTYEA